MGIWKIMSHFHTLYNSKTAVGICKYFFADRKKDDKICAWKSRWQVSDAVFGTGCSGQFEASLRNLRRHTCLRLFHHTSQKFLPVALLQPANFCIV